MTDIRRISRLRTIGVFDSHPDTVELLRLLFEADGFRVVTVDLREVRAGRIDVAAARSEHRFDAVVFDVALPYQANWQLFLELRERDLSGLPVVLTTTNERALGALVGQEPLDVIEIWGKPYDTERLRARVHAVLDLAERRARSEDRRQAPYASPEERRGAERRRPAVNERRGVVS